MACVALAKSALEYAVFKGGLGYSRERGPSNGLPPGIIFPCRLPALPEMP